MRFAINTQLREQLTIPRHPRGDPEIGRHRPGKQPPERINPRDAGKQEFKGAAPARRRIACNPDHDEPRNDKEQVDPAKSGQKAARKHRCFAGLTGFDAMQVREHDRQSSKGTQGLNAFQLGQIWPSVVSAKLGDEIHAIST